MGRPGLGQGRVCETQAWKQPPEENSGTGLLLPAPPHPPGGPARPSPCPSSELILELQQASPGRWEDEGGGLLFPEPSRGPLTHRPARGAEAAAVRDVRMRRGAQVVHGHTGPEPAPLPSTPSQPGRALERQASPNPLVSKPCRRPPEATLEPKAKEQKSKDEALDTGAHRPRGQP